MNNGSMMDKVLVSIALLGLIAFFGVVIKFVPEPDLTITIILMLLLASYDFWISVFRAKEPPGTEPGSELKGRYTAVSGKPLESATELEEQIEKELRSGGSKKRSTKPKRRRK